MSETEIFFTFKDKKIIVDKISKFLRQTEYFLVDTDESKRIGQYEIYNNSIQPKHTSICNSIIQLGNHEYCFKVMSSNHRSSFLKSNSDGQDFKFKIYQRLGKEYADFTINIGNSNYRKSSETKYRPFVGEIETNMTDLVAILSTCYLIEKTFDYQDYIAKGY